jgi:hypothetical protein
MGNDAVVFQYDPYFHFSWQEYDEILLETDKALLIRFKDKEFPSWVAKSVIKNRDKDKKVVLIHTDIFTHSKPCKKKHSKSFKEKHKFQDSTEVVQVT